MVSSHPLTGVMGHLLQTKAFYPLKSSLFMRLKLRIALLHLCQKVKLGGQKYKTSILAQNRTFDF